MSAAVTASAGEDINAGAFEVTAKSAVLMELSGGQILYAKNPDEKLWPASITKIMSLLLVMEALDDGRISLDDVVTASKNASHKGGSEIWLEGASR